MLDFLGEKEGAHLILKAVENVVQQRDILTPDLGGKGKTDDVGRAICSEIEAM